MVQFSTAVANLGAFVKELPEYYKTVTFTDPLCAIIVSVHAIMIVGLFLAMKSALCSLIIIFFLLLCSYATTKLDSLLTGNAALLLERHYISRDYFIDSGRFTAAIWTIPIFFYTVFFALCLIILLTKEIIQECGKRKHGDKLNNTELTDDAPACADATGEDGKKATTKNTNKGKGKK